MTSPKVNLVGRREFWLPLTTLIVNSDKDRADGTHVAEVISSIALADLRTMSDGLFCAWALITERMSQSQEMKPISDALDVVEKLTIILNEKKNE